ncbi:MAG: hypothetical protein ACKOA9_05110, partial [Actinomycetota bacterium]
PHRALNRDAAVIDLRARHSVRVTVPVPDPALFTLDALAAAATELPPEQVEHHRAVGLPMLLPDGAVERAAMPVADVIRRIDDGDSWVMLVGLGALERYRATTMQMTAPLLLAARAAGETPVAVDLVAFVASDGARVPFHCDTGHHLLLQLEGTKTVAVGWYDDPDVEHAMLLDSVGRGRANPSRAPDRVDEVVLAPGEALALPAFCFHGVTESKGRSVALTALVRTDVTRATADRLDAESRASAAS